VPSKDRLVTKTQVSDLSAGAQREVARRRLAAMRIAPADRRGVAAIPDPVRSLLAMQAQDLGSGYWSIGVRTGASLADVEAAVDAHLITRSWPMRGTLHFLATEDVRWMCRLLNEPDERGDPGPLGRARDHRRRPGPRSRRRRRSADRVSATEPAGGDGPAQWQRHLAGRPARPAHPQQPLPRRAGLQLLPGFDRYILGYKDRSAMLTSAQERLVVPGGNGVFPPTVVLGGQVIGTWGRQVTVAPFRDLTPTHRRDVTRAAAAYGDFLGLPAEVRVNDAATDGGRTTG